MTQGTRDIKKRQTGQGELSESHRRKTYKVKTHTGKRLA